MQKLHLVGFTTDQQGLILSARRGARSGSFQLPVDDALTEAVEELRARQAEAAADSEEPQSALVTRTARVESALPVREIQARLRQGRTVHDVAKAAGVEPGWVERFAAPVFAEQAEVITKVRGMFLARPRLGPSSHAIGDAVRHNLAERGVSLSPEEFAAAWSTRQLADGRWVVRFAFRSRNKDQSLRFHLDEARGAVLAADRSSGQLGYVAPGPALSVPASERARPANADVEEASVGKRATVTTGFRPEGQPVKALSRSAKERERASLAMRKGAAKRAAEGERAAARKTKEKQEAARRRERAAKAEEARQLRERAAAEKAKVAVARTKAAAAKRAAEEKARLKQATQAAAQARRAEAALAAAEKAKATGRTATRKPAAKRTSTKRAASPATTLTTALPRKPTSPRPLAPSGAGTSSPPRKKVASRKAAHSSQPVPDAVPLQRTVTGPAAPGPRLRSRPRLRPSPEVVPGAGQQPGPATGMPPATSAADPYGATATRAQFRAGLVEPVGGPVGSRARPRPDEPLDGDGQPRRDEPAPGRRDNGDAPRGLKRFRRPRQLRAN